MKKDYIFKGMIAGSCLQIARFGAMDGEVAVDENHRPADESDVWESLGRLESSSPVIENTPNEIIQTNCKTGKYDRQNLMLNTASGYDFTSRDISWTTLELMFGITKTDGNVYIPFSSSGNIQVWVKVTLTDALDNGRELGKIYFQGDLTLTTPPTASVDPVTSTFNVSIVYNSLATVEGWIVDDEE